MAGVSLLTVIQNHIVYLIATSRPAVSSEAKTR